MTAERYVLSTYFSRYVSAWMPPAAAIVPDAVSGRGSDDERERHALGASNFATISTLAGRLDKGAREIRASAAWQTVWKKLGF